MTPMSCQIKISIIIPFYNIGDYVAKCLDSVIAQDMTDFEIIAVNDGSTDDTSSVLDKYKRKDSRIQVFHLQHGGQSWARNYGVSKASGEYIMFIDGDDFIIPGCLSKLYNYIKSNNADIVISSYLYRKYNSTDLQIHRLYPKDKLMGALEAAKFLLLSGDYSVCNKIIRREFYVEKNISFEEGVILEDEPVSFKLVCAAERIFYIDLLFYVHVQRSTSTTNSALTFKRIRDEIHAFERIKAEMHEVGYEHELTTIFTGRYITILVNLITTCYKNPEKYISQEELKRSELFLKEHLGKIIFARIFLNRHLKFSYKMKIYRIKSGIYKWEKVISRKFKTTTF